MQQRQKTTCNFDRGVKNWKVEILHVYCVKHGILHGPHKDLLSSFGHQCFLSISSIFFSLPRRFLFPFFFALFFQIGFNSPQFDRDICNVLNIEVILSRFSSHRALNNYNLYVFICILIIKVFRISFLTFFFFILSSLVPYINYQYLILRLRMSFFLLLFFLKKVL